jgi:CHC2 zinc finger
MLPPREFAALVPMPILLQALRIEVNERTRRCPCILHGGSNPTAFSWRDDGIWYCHACGAGGDRISLVRAVRNYSFHDAMAFLAQLAGVQYVPQRLSRQEIERTAIYRNRCATAAWKIRDEVSRLRTYYRDGLQRSERLWLHLGEELRDCVSEEDRQRVWCRMERLAPVNTFFLAAHNFLYEADALLRVQVALAAPEQRRALICGGINGYNALQAA